MKKEVDDPISSFIEELKTPGVRLVTRTAPNNITATRHWSDEAKKAIVEALERKKK